MINGITADTIDNSISIIGTIGGFAAQRILQSNSFPKFNLPPNTITNTQVNRASSFFGSRYAPLDYAPYQKIRNEPALINGRKYTGHALDRMQDRGFMPSIIEHAINISKTTPRRLDGTLECYDAVNKVKVIIGESDQVITIIPGRR